MLSVEGFRLAFPEFGDATVYPDTRAQWWLNLGEKMCNPQRWGDFTEAGVYLLMAHNLYLEHERTTGGGSAGTVGPVSSISKSIDGVSKSVSMSVGHYDAAGQWAATIYGQQYYDLMMMVGAGGIQL